MERKQFGPMGYNMKYPFSIGDLRDSATCLQNYMDNIGGGKIRNELVISPKTEWTQWHVQELSCTIVP